MPTLVTPRSVVHDENRIAAVASYQLPGHAGDPDLEAVVAYLTDVISVPVAAINLVTPQQQCYPAEKGLEVAGTTVRDDVSMCSYVVASSSRLQVPDAKKHPVFSQNPLVAMGPIGAYLGVPLIDEDGFVLGTLSVADSIARVFTSEDERQLHVQAQLVRALLALRRRTSAHEWVSTVLALQARALDAMAVDKPLDGIIEQLDAEAWNLSAHADDAQRQALRHTVERLVEITAIGCNRRRQIERMTQADAVREMESQHASKMESLGQLSAGLAHEINTPIQFVGDNTRFLAESYEAMLELLLTYRRVLDPAAAAMSWQERQNVLQRAEAEADIDYLASEIPSAVAQSLDGVNRVASIVQAMKTFSHPGQDEQAPADLNEALHATVTVARSQVKYVADVEVDLGDLPSVTCNVGELNQVFLNLIVNAAHAIEDTGERGVIKVRTSRSGDNALVEISDTGVGISEEMRLKIFEPFFTTKDVGRGTGQGLALASAVVRDRHGGSIALDSTVGAGSTFTVSIPIEGSR